MNRPLSLLLRFVLEECARRNARACIGVVAWRTTEQRTPELHREPVFLLESGSAQQFDRKERLPAGTIMRRKQLGELAVDGMAQMRDICSFCCTKVVDQSDHQSVVDEQVVRLLTARHQPLGGRTCGWRGRAV